MVLFSFIYVSLVSIVSVATADLLTASDMRGQFVRCICNIARHDRPYRDFCMISNGFKFAFSRLGHVIVEPSLAADSLSETCNGMGTNV